MIKSIDWEIVGIVAVLALLASPLVASAVVVTLHFTGAAEVPTNLLGFCLAMLVAGLAALPRALIEGGNL